MELIKEWVRNIFILILVLSFMENFLPVTNTRKYLKFVFSLIIMASVLSPLMDFVE